MANSIDGQFGKPSDNHGMLSQVGYKGVYYSCLILSFAALLISLFCVRVPEAMRGTIWNKRLPPPSTVEAVAPEHKFSEAIKQQTDGASPVSTKAKQEFLFAVLDFGTKL